MSGLLWGSQVSAAQQKPRVIVAGRMIAPDGQLVIGQAVSVRVGQIVSVSSVKEVVDGADVVRYPHAVLSPGLIDAVSSLGAVGEAMEQAYSVDPAASAVDAVDVKHRDFRTALRAGVTAALIAPGRQNLVCGAAAVLSTASSSGDPSWLRTDGPLTFSLGAPVLSPDRAPTSRIGALAMLRDVLVQAGAGQGHDRLKAFVRGKLDGLVFCEQAMDVRAALRTLGSFGSRVVFVHKSFDQDVGAELSAKRHVLVVGPYHFGTSSAVIGAAVSATQAGVPVVFAGGLPAEPVESLRISAALAVRNGMAPAAARRAITFSAAMAIGVGDRIGAIKPGLRADLVVFSDDPLRLNARVLAVYVSGELVYQAVDQEQD